MNVDTFVGDLPDRLGETKVKLRNKHTYATKTLPILQLSILILFSMITGAQAQISFKPPVTLSMPNNATDIAIGDFNKDGILDIASSTNVGQFPANPARSFVFLGTGGGAFSSPATLDPGGECWSAGQLKVADVNNDGVLDVILAEGGSNQFCFGNKVSVQLGDGNGGFASPGIITSTGGSLLSFAVGDFNEDGKLDLAVRLGDEQAIAILFGVGDGTFTSGPILGGGFPENIVVKDLNGDGHLDLAATYDTGVKIFFGTGTGTFTGPTEYSFSNPQRFGIAIGDFNEDGIPDLAVSNGSNGAIFVLFGTGKGGFSSPIAFAAGSNPQSEVIIADFDGDGHEDIAIGNCGAGSVSILLGNGKGGFAAPVTFPAGSGDSCRLASADLDGDGRPDLVASSQQGIAVLLNNSQSPRKPPVAVCRNVTVGADSACKANASIDGGSSDPQGETLTLTQSPPNPYSLGLTPVSLTATNTSGESSRCSGQVTVLDNTPPQINSISASPSILWPPNHKLVPISLAVSASDNCSAASCKVVSVSSNEPVSTGNDWTITSDSTVMLRAERLGGGSGRVYTIIVQCKDASQNVSMSNVLVTVPHDQGH